MNIKRIRLENVRSFEHQVFDVQRRFVIIQGRNGAGKTTILEALHYACYLRSFRTPTHKDLIMAGKDHFFIEIEYYDHQLASDEKIQVGFSPKQGKMVKLNAEKIKSYKELIAHYKVITLTADDLKLINGTPEDRREFLNFALIFQDSTMLHDLKEYKKILESRNALIEHQASRLSAQSEELKVWTEQLWCMTLKIQQRRISYLTQLSQGVNKLLQDFYSTKEEELTIKFSYDSRNTALHRASFENFWHFYQTKLFEQEIRFRRSLFGIHLDDFIIEFQAKKAKAFASRGQQKLIAFLVKVFQVQDSLQRNLTAVFLIDDFLTDFDHARIGQCFDLIENLQTQVFVTIPLEDTPSIYYKVPKEFDLIQLS